MSPITHFLASWALAERLVTDRRSRLYVTIAGVIPDLDGLGVVVDSVNRVIGRPESDWFSALHHFLLARLFGALIAMGVFVMLGVRRWQVLWLICLSYHLHLLCVSKLERRHRPPLRSWSHEAPTHARGSGGRGQWSRGDGALDQELVTAREPSI